MRLEILKNGFRIEVHAQGIEDEIHFFAKASEDFDGFVFVPKLGVDLENAGTVPMKVHDSGGDDEADLFRHLDLSLRDGVKEN